MFLLTQASTVLHLDCVSVWIKGFAKRLTVNVSGLKENTGGESLACSLLVLWILVLWPG